MKTLKQLLAVKASQEIVSITSNQSVYEALVVMADKKIGALAVIDDDQLVGIFSERDFARKVDLFDRTAKSTQIDEVMTRDLKSSSLEDTVEDAMNIMSNFRIRHLPVLEGGKMVGILSIGDLVKETIDYQASLIQQLESYIQG